MSVTLWIDTETTGMTPGWHEVIEVAILPEADGRLSTPYVARLRPDHPERIEPRALEVNGFSRDDLAGFPERRGGLKALQDYLREFKAGEVVFGGHHVSYDLAMLREMYRFTTALGEPDVFWEYSIARRWDTYSLASALKLSGLKMPGKLSLGALADHFGVDQGRAHRALDDAKTAREVWWRMVENIRSLRG